MTSPSRSHRARATLLAALLLPRGCHARPLRRAIALPDAAVDEEEGFQVFGSNDGARYGLEIDGDSVDGTDASSDARRWPGVEDAEETGVGAVAPKQYRNNTRLTFADPNDALHARVDRACTSNEKLWNLKFRTDAYGYETSWSLESKDAATNAWTTLVAGPPGRQKYRDNTVYRGATCLAGDVMYRLTIADAYADGFCCRFGAGYYGYAVGGIDEYDTMGVRTFDKKGTHVFYVGLPTPEYGSIDSYFTREEQRVAASTPFAGRDGLSCGPRAQAFRLKITTDKFPGDNTWKFESLEDTREVHGSATKEEFTAYGKNAVHEWSTCIPYGRHQFTITDSTGDGLCCRQGNGQYELYLDGELLVYGADFNSGRERTHVIVAGYHERYRNLTTRETQYLDAHNWRRRKYHEAYGVDYQPLKYDLSLQADAASWAEELLRDCHVTGIEHEPGVDQGENLAKNTGNGKWGILFPVENLVRRWFEREETWGYPENAHLTQGLWRSALYVGCAESESAMGNGGTCRIQVCRYARAGNCNMGAHKAREGENWKVPTLARKNPCGPACPPNGCH